MQTIARRIAGLGTLPTRPAAPTPGSTKNVDALVVGAGAAGCAAAATLSSEGYSVTLVDDGLRLGGSLTALGRAAESAFLARHSLSRVEVMSRSVALGVYQPPPGGGGGDAGATHTHEVLVAGPSGGAVLRPRVLVLATGAHDGTMLFEGNDLPGVVSARAAARLAAEGITIGARVALVGEGPFGDALTAHLAGHAEVTRIPEGALIRVIGSSRVGGVVIRDGKGERRLRADALALEAQPAPAFELVAQAGGDVCLRDGAFLPPRGHRIGARVFVAGEVRGLPFDPEELAADGTEAARAAVAALRSA